MSWCVVWLLWTQARSTLPRFTVYPHNSSSPPSPASRVETFLPGLLWISKMAILVHTAVMLIACGRLESEGGGAMSLFACFSEKCRGAQRSRQRSAMTDLRLYVASLAYRCYRFWVARLNINIARYHYGTWLNGAGVQPAV